MSMSTYTALLPTIQ